MRRRSAGINFRLLCAITSLNRAGVAMWSRLLALALLLLPAPALAGVKEKVAALAPRRWCS